MAVLLVVLVDASHYNNARVLVGLVRRRAAVRRVPVLDAAGEGRDEPRAGLRRGDALREAKNERDVAGDAANLEDPRGEEMPSHVARSEDRGELSACGSEALTN